MNTESDQITIEHIFPQKPDARWKEVLSKEDYFLMGSKHLHTLANLTLSGNNGQLGNKPFEEKRAMNVNDREQGYAYSRLWLNADLRSAEQWGIAELGKRYERMYKRFLEIWPYPSVSEIPDSEAEDLYGLSDAPDPRHKKLAFFQFREERVIVSDIAKMYLHVMSALFEERPELFLSTDLKATAGISDDEAALRMATPINDSYFIEMNMDNNSKFRRLRLVLERFDLLDELAFRYQEG